MVTLKIDEPFSTRQPRIEALIERLPPGRYVLVLTVTTADGKKSKPAQLPFELRKRNS